MTGRVIPLHEDRHRRIQALLPWYVVGGLSGDERIEVKAHLDGCNDCQAKLRDEQRLAAEVAELPVEAGALDVEHGWALISRQIAPQARRPERLDAGLVRTFRERREAAGSRRSEAGSLRWVVAAQLCVILALGAQAWRTTQPAAYKTLGGAPADTAANLIVVFRPETPEKDLRAILRSNNARLVDGPTATDAYLLHVPPAGRAAALIRLRQQAQITVAEPLDGGADR
jgi:hypothetical protein